MKLRGAYVLGLAVVALGVFDTRAAAQVVVIGVEPTAEPLCGAIESALGAWGITPDPGYLAEAARQGLDPASEPPTAAGEEPAVPTDERLGMDMRVSAGAGVGARSLTWPQNGETLVADTGLFPALDLAARFDLLLTSNVALGLALAYQTSIGAKLEENHIGGRAAELSVRAHDFSAALALALGGPGLRVTPALGYVTRGLRPEVHHLLTPSYSLAGPLLRVAVRIPITRAFGVRLVPEGQYLLVGHELQLHGVSSTGFGFGGEVALELAVSGALSLELSGRWVRAWLGTREGASAADTERFATVRVVWQL